MAERERRWGWMAVPLAAVALWAVTCGKNDPDGDGRSGRPGASESPAASKTKKLGERDPARFAGDVRTYARKAGVSARLLMTILYNEADKPHDPELERAWQKFKKDAAFGIANMHRAAFDEAKRGRFADRRWEELPDDPSLAVEAAAWYLHDLARALPSARSDAYTRNELLAMGYNAGASNMRAFARGVAPGRDARSYLERFRENGPAAEKALRS